MSSGWGYAIFCVVAPVAWGLVVYWVSGAIERRVVKARKTGLGQEDAEVESLSVEYYI